MLTANQTIQHLLRQEFIQPETIVSENIRIINLNRRNQNFQISGLSETNYFIKQGTRDLDLGSIANEALVYQVFQEQYSDRQLGSYIPQYFGYDQQAGILTLEAIPNAQDLKQYYTNQKQFPKTIAREMGTAMGILHNINQQQLRLDGVDSKLKPFFPNVFRLTCPPLDILQSASGVNIKLIKILQQYPQFAAEFAKLAEQWQIESIVHGDIKLSNFLAYKTHSSGRIKGIKLIDWEFAGIGDPRWDVGSVFSNYLTLWLFSVPIVRHDQAERFLDLAEFPLTKIQPVINLFWQTYLETRNIDKNIEGEYLIDALRFAAVYLIQTAYEFSKSSNHLTAEIVLLIQLSLNIFKKPEQAVMQLLGLDI